MYEVEIPEMDDQKTLISCGDWMFSGTTQYADTTLGFIILSHSNDRLGLG